MLQPLYQFETFTRSALESRPIYPLRLTARRPVQDCRGFPFWCRPLLGSFAPLPRTVAPPNQAFPAHGNSGPTNSSLSGAYSDSDALGAVPATPLEIDRQERAALPNLKEVDDQLDSDRAFS